MFFSFSQFVVLFPLFTFVFVLFVLSVHHLVSLPWSSPRFLLSPLFASSDFPLSLSLSTGCFLPPCFLVFFPQFVLSSSWALLLCPPFFRVFGLPVFACLCSSFFVCFSCFVPCAVPLSSSSLLCLCPCFSPLVMFFIQLVPPPPPSVLFVAFSGFYKARGWPLFVPQDNGARSLLSLRRVRTVGLDIVASGEGVVEDNG